MKESDAQRSSGFSLLEVTVVLVIVGVLLASGISALSSRNEKNLRDKNQLYLDSIRDALVWYTKSRGRMPCPDTDGDGMGNLTGTTCTQLVGVLPWVELELTNVKGLDVWGRYFTYHVGQAYSLGAINRDTGTSSDLFCVIATNNHCVIQVNDVSGTPSANDAPAIVVSHGKNGSGHFRFVGAALVQVPADPNDIADLPERENANGVAENADAARNLVYTRGAGDDMILWLSQATLKSQP